MPDDKVGFAKWASDTRMTEHVLIRATECSIATGAVPRGVVRNDVGFSRWAIIAQIKLARVAEAGIAVSIAT
jgi:hypothetical protein